MCLVILVREEKKSSSVKDVTEEPNGDVKAASVKSEKISTHRDRNDRSKTKEGSRHRSRDSGKPRSGVLTFAQIKVCYIRILCFCIRLLC